MALTEEQGIRLRLLEKWAERGRVAPGSPEAEELVRLSVGRDLPGAVSEVVAVVPSMLGLATEKQQAAYYGVSRRTINNWKKKHAPLGDPAAMYAWWPRAFPRLTVNVGILTALARWRAGRVEMPDQTVGDPVADLEQELEPEPEPDGAEVEEGVDATLGRLAAEEARSYGRMKALERAGRHEEAEALRPGWQRMAAALGEASNQQQRLMQRRGDLVSLALVQREYALLLVNHPEVLRAGIKKLRLLLQPTPPAHEWDVQVDRLVDDLFRGLPRELMGRAEEIAAA